MCAEDERLRKELEFLSLKKELADKFTKVRESYAALMEKTHEVAEVVPAMPKKAKDNASAVEKKLEVLKAEEDRLNQMRSFLEHIAILLADWSFDFFNGL